LISFYEVSKQHKQEGVNKVSLSQSLMGYYENSLRQDQLIALILINFLGDPDLVVFFLKVLRQVEYETSRDFHLSLRNSYLGLGAQKRIGANHQNRIKPEYIAGVPLNCDRPITADQWRMSRQLMRTIDYTYRGFLQIDPSYPDIPDAFVEVDTCEGNKIYWKLRILDLYMKQSQDFKKCVEGSYQKFRGICDKYAIESIKIVDLPEYEYDIIPFLCLSRYGGYTLDKLEIIE